MSDNDFNEAKQLYLEKYGDAIVTNNYLKIAVALLCLAALGLVALNLRTIHTFQHFRPLVIRIDQLGRAEAVEYKSLEYHPGDREAKYFLSEFCRLYYRRNRYTIQDDLTKALYFLDGKLANDTMEQHKKEDTVHKFLTNPSSPEVDIQVEKVALDAMQESALPGFGGFLPGRIRSGGPFRSKEDAPYGEFRFPVQRRGPNELIPVNPLGMTITYFRQDEAFTDEVTR